MELTVKTNNGFITMTKEELFRQHFGMDNVGSYEYARALRLFNILEESAQHDAYHSAIVAGCDDCTNVRTRLKSVEARQFAARTHRPTSDGLPREDEVL